MRRRRHHWLELLLVSEGCAFLFAVVFVVVQQLSLPPTDGAHGQAPFADPLVLPVMSVFAAIAGLLVWPFMYVVLRNRPLTHCLPVVIAVTLAWIVIVTPLHSGGGFLGSFLALGTALLACRWIFPQWRPPGHCQRCGYDLTGNVSGRCPECGTPIERGGKPA
jgi:hypothetical protein